MKLEYIVVENKYENIRQILKNEFYCSDRLITKLKKANQIYVNHKEVPIDSKFEAGDIVSVLLDFEEISDNIVPTKMPLSILYEDEAMLVVNKPAGIPVHPSMDHYTDSLSNGIKHYFNDIGLHRKIRPVNRLDRNTSGIVIFAKNEYVQECFIKQMQRKEFQKEYLALLEGKLEEMKRNYQRPYCQKTRQYYRKRSFGSGCSFYYAL